MHGGISSAQITTSTNNSKRGSERKKSQNVYLELLLALEHIIFNLTKETLHSLIQKTLDLLDTNLPYSFNINISKLIYLAFVSRKNKSSIYINYLKSIQVKEEEMKKSNSKIFDFFIEYISNIKSQESNYLIAKIIDLNLVHKDIIIKNKSKYFAHYKTEKESKQRYFQPFEITFINNYEELSKNDWELHKKYVKEGHNPNEIAKIIRNDEVEKLREISTETNFDYNQIIDSSLYERCSFINEDDVTLIDYAAFFGSVKCFKYLLMNNANVINTGKYAVAGGNEEIIHLCEQNHSTFKDAYKTAIEFHRNYIFHYLYVNNIGKIKDLQKLGRKCVLYYNYEILLFLLEKGMEINDDIINESAKIGNIFLTKYFFDEYYIPKNVLIFSAKSGNIECFEYILRKDIFDINAKDIYLFYLRFILII